VLRAEPAEVVVSEWVCARFDSPALLKRLDAKAPSMGGVGLRLKEARARLAGLATAYGAGELAEVEWRAARVATQRAIEREEATIQVAAGKLAVSAPLPDGPVRGACEGLTSDRQRALIEVVLERIDVAPSRRIGPHFDTARLKPRWRAPSRPWRDGDV
jgi:hypothetical protein